jgi:hypothetical protein
MIVLLVVAAAVVGAPVGAAVLVTLASHREDYAHSLAGRPPGLLTAAARALLCVRIGGSTYPQRPSRRSRRRKPAIRSAADRAAGAHRVPGTHGGIATAGAVTVSRPD